jgi:hypothetical protein
MSYLTLTFDENTVDQMDVHYAGCALDEALTRLEVAVRSHAIERDRLLPTDRTEQEAARFVWDATFVRLQKDLEEVRRHAGIATRVARVAMRRALDGELS